MTLKKTRRQSLKVYRRLLAAWAENNYLQDCLNFPEILDSICPKKIKLIVPLSGFDQYTKPIKTSYRLSLTTKLKMPNFEILFFKLPNHFLHFK